MIQFKNPLTNLKGFLSSQPGGFFAPPQREGFEGLLSDPRVNIGLAIASGQPIGQAILGGAYQAQQLEDVFQEREAKQKRNKFIEKIGSDDEITENDYASAFPEKYAEYFFNKKFTDQEPLSQIGKLRYDYKNGLITESEYTDKVKKLTSLEQFAPSDAEKWVDFFTQVNPGTSDKEALEQYIKIKTTEKAPTKGEFQADVFLKSMTYSTDVVKAEKNAKRAGEIWDQNFSNNPSAQLDLDAYIEAVNRAIADGYTNIANENGKIMATSPDGVRGEITPTFGE